MSDIYAYQQCDRWAWKTRCPKEATTFENNGQQWCNNHAPPPSPELARAIHVLKDAGLIPR